MHTIWYWPSTFYTTTPLSMVSYGAGYITDQDMDSNPSNIHAMTIRWNPLTTNYSFPTHSNSPNNKSIISENCFLSNPFQSMIFALFLTFWPIARPRLPPLGRQSSSPRESPWTQREESPHRSQPSIDGDFVWWKIHGEIMDLWYMNGTWLDMSSNIRISGVIKHGVPENGP